MARMPVGAGLDDDLGSDEGPDFPQSNGRRGRDRHNDRGGKLSASDDDVRSTTGSDHSGATVVLHDDPKDKDESPPLEILTGDDALAGLGDEDDDERIASDQRAYNDEDDGRSRSQRSRDARRRRRDRAQQARDRELEDLRRKIAELEGAVSNSDRTSLRANIAQIEGQINGHAVAFQNAELKVAAAIKAGDGDGAALAMRERDQAAANLANARAVHQRAVSATREQPQIRLDPSVQRHATTWMRSNPWYDPQGADEDSAITMAIDSQLSRDGFDPATPEFWDELDDRLRQRLPHLFEDERQSSRNRRRDDEDRRPMPRNRDRDDDDRRPQRRGPPVGVSNGSGVRRNPNGTRSVYIDPDFKQALQEAGVWDDKKRLKRVLDHRLEFNKRESERGRSSR